MNAEIFREYDIRGHAERDLDNDTVEMIAKAFASMVIEKDGRIVCLGRDNRESSERISSVFSKGLTDSGLKVLDVGVVPIPALYYSVIAFSAQGGAMVTGSHLAKEFNGLKLSAEKTAATLFGEQIQDLRKRAEKEEFLSLKEKGVVEKKNVLNSFIGSIAQRAQLERPLTVVIDCGNGTASLVAEQILRALGCRVSALYCTLDSSYPNHHPDPVKPENLQALIAKVRKEKADLGVAFDGEADRLGVVDEKGNILWGDVLLSLFAQDVLEKHPRAKVVFEVKCSKMVEDVVRKEGGIPILWKTGHSLIKKKMREEGALLAGEMSGHIFFADSYFGFDDALFAAARLCEIVSKNGSLSKMVEELPKYYSTPELRVECGEKEKWLVVEKAKKYFSGKYEINTIDGVRVDFRDGWALVRASNTSSVLVLRMESNTKEGLERIKNAMRGAMKVFAPNLKLGF
ncbi:MAG: phosphomannomutase/phosphoglucomutase [Candidatus Diapherotrites archaeon]|nr:phosphomannomutase/phosphoglucomutase [Candidatus Diapherotrites archaeon]